MFDFGAPLQLRSLPIRRRSFCLDPATAGNATWPIRVTWTICFMLAVAMPLPAQPTSSQSEQSRREELRKKRQQRKGNLTPYDTSTGEKRVLWWETNRFKAFTKGYKGLRPIIGGMDDPVVFGAVSSGSGLVPKQVHQY